MNEVSLSYQKKREGAVLQKMKLRDLFGNPVEAHTAKVDVVVLCLTSLFQNRFQLFHEVHFVSYQDRVILFRLTKDIRA